MRSIKLFKNVIASLFLQIVIAVSGFVLPQILITRFGSEIYGLTASITQFLGYVTLLEAGIGVVVRTELYKPLAENDTDKINGILKASRSYFRMIAYALVAYAVILSFTFSFISKVNQDYFFTVSLVGIMAIGSFIQYFFGLSNQILLYADQKVYIQNLLDIIGYGLNMALAIVLVKLGAGIHLVKLIAVLAFAIRPIALNLYVKRKYTINYHVPTDKLVLKQRWYSLAQHVSNFVLRNTDIVVLTLMTTLKEVSVYSVYLMVVTAIRNLVMTFTNGVDAFFGNMLAKQQTELLNQTFKLVEFIFFSAVTILFTTTSILILPFITIYSKGFSDANYIRPVFAYILVAGQAFFCLRLLYQQLVFAAGHYKQTSLSSAIEVVVNLSVSVVTVLQFGLPGVAIGTFVAMTYRLIQLAMYASKHLLKRSYRVFVKHMVVMAISVVIILLLNQLMPLNVAQSYFSWFLYAFETLLMVTAVVALMSLVFFRDELFSTMKRFRFLLKPKRGETGL